MPSFDVVSEVDKAELDNAFQQAKKELETRYDFKGAKASIEKQGDDSFQVKAIDAEKLGAVREVFFAKLAKRGISLRNLDLGRPEESGVQLMKQTLKIAEGIPADKAKKLVAKVKESKLKVQPSIQGDALRITGKNKDDLQQAIALLRGQSDALEVELQFTNFRD